MKICLSLVICSLLAAGCASPQEKAKDAEDAQREASERSANAGDEVAKKNEEAQRQADEQKAAQARDEAKKVEEAQADAARKSAEAAQALTKARADAQSSSESRLSDLEKQLAEVKPKLVKKLSKKESDATLKDLTAKSDAVRASIAELSTAPAEGLDPVKATIDQRLKDFEQALNDAKKRL